MKKIRNFCIIAHIDHGKSTLADRLLEVTGTVTKRDAQEQLLDNMDLERERGITIKSHAMQMEYNGYTLNLIDTPGHVDFSYEVSRSIAACEGALLIVDAAQGIQAQTISNLYLALGNDLEIIPVVNKVDLLSAEPEVVADQIIDLIGCTEDEIIPASAKTGIGIENILKAIIERVPSPKGDINKPLQAMIFDSVYNPFRGIEAYFKILNGEIQKGDKVKFIATGKEYFADEIGALISAIGTGVGSEELMVNPSVSVIVPSVLFCTFTSQLPMVASLGMAKSALKYVSLNAPVIVPSIVEPSLENPTVVGVPCAK